MYTSIMPVRQTPSFHIKTVRSVSDGKCQESGIHCMTSECCTLQPVFFKYITYVSPNMAVEWLERLLPIGSTLAAVSALQICCLVIFLWFY